MLMQEGELVKTNSKLGYEKVIAWMPLPEPYKESE